ncbi:hypothetical protein [Xylanimonas protaetiae]|uniref:ABC transporter ATP-binding protein n=1 Tax=Xylanimonas protaetiae TaxID=2509457 RepID=A0A4P6F8F3_9MICO|nr:hypothetical protein [Xylanimonas protaetiae]QAY71163.1 hypothetical protein ET471_14885 [Xylanimonas protaetiae]
MPLQLTGVSVAGRHGPLLETFDLSLAQGERVLLAAEPGHGHTALALVAAGRLVPDAGGVLMTSPNADASTPAGAAALRAAAAVVDVPGVDEPDEVLTVGAVVAEGLVCSGRHGLPRDVHAWVEAFLDRWGSRWPAAVDARALRRRRIDLLPAAVRTALLAELAAGGPQVRYLVLTLPDRHGGDPADWWALAGSLAARGYGVLVLATPSSARALGADVPATRGLHTPPVVALRETAQQPTADLLGALR